MTRYLPIALLAAFLLVGCDAHDMADQTKKEAYETSDLFPDGSISRPLVPGVVPRDGPISPTPVGNGFPFALTDRDLVRGQQRFDIYCAPCHGRLGDGSGMIVQRGFPRPPSFYLPRLRDATPRHFYDVISNGYGAMYSYNDRVPPEDRWKIAAYIRALQLGDPTNPGQLGDTSTRQ